MALKMSKMDNRLFVDVKPNSNLSNNGLQEYSNLNLNQCAYKSSDQSLIQSNSKSNFNKQFGKTKIIAAVAIL